MSRRLVGPAALLAAACGTAVAPEPTGDYTSWPVRLETYGPAPGHGDTYRVIYANDVAAISPPGDYGPLADAGMTAVVVKEVRDNVNNTPGPLRYLAIMRKQAGTDGDPTQGLWLFTRAETPGGAEVQHDFCWDRCHVSAPLFGVWLDYSASTTQ
ncbi:MAG: hypothetical protein KBG28_20355 [Kofleriaceae bacterium]|jgi:hypothetical protein|nr:hypothetical protein [Kofleriaceae bacterium]MBP6838177.1 hypothetical protein [Kofleriaceae bacterium]MBP9206336.1 hypothetical protein [Kofleriaceae bacterium]